MTYTSTGASRTACLADLYQSLVSTKTIKADADQLSTVRKLSAIADVINGTNKKWWHKWWHNIFGAPKPSGLYLYGPVGRGKTMVMNLFYDYLITPKKTRMHFHEFMQDVQKRLKKLRAKDKSKADSLARVAKQFAKDYRVLCFDEFIVEDIADVMILGRLFEVLIKEDVCIIATSNVKPDDLYENGLQRERFIPFIHLIKQKLNVIKVSGPVDYRLERLKGAQTFYTPNNKKANQTLDKFFTDLTDETKGQPTTVDVNGRKLTIPAAAKDTALFTFKDLCDKPLSSADYLALAQHFHTIIIKDVPKLSDRRQDQARRFINLIDVLYDQKKEVIISAETAIDKLYPKTGRMKKIFERTQSRLFEMQSDDYLKKVIKHTD